MAVEDNENEIRMAFQGYDKQGSGQLELEEIKHVMSKIGDVISPEEQNNFFNQLVHPDGMIKMEELVNLLLPQTAKDIYSKTTNLPQSF